MHSFANDPMWAKCNRLADELRQLGVEHAATYQDGTSGGLICVRIPLTDDASEFSTSLYVGTEDDLDAESVIKWTGQVVYADGDCSDTLHTVFERRLHGDTEAAPAAEVAKLVRLYRREVAEAHA